LTPAQLDQLLAIALQQKKWDDLKVILQAGGCNSGRLKVMTRVCKYLNDDQLELN
jgi:hypothetical protein